MRMEGDPQLTAWGAMRGSLEVDHQRGRAIDLISPQQVVGGYFLMGAEEKECVSLPSKIPDEQGEFMPAPHPPLSQSDESLLRPPGQLGAGHCQSRCVTEQLTGNENGRLTVCSLNLPQESAHNTLPHIYLSHMFDQIPPLINAPSESTHVSFCPAPYNQESDQNLVSQISLTHSDQMTPDYLIDVHQLFLPKPSLPHKTNQLPHLSLLSTLDSCQINLPINNRLSSDLDKMLQFASDMQQEREFNSPSFDYIHLPNDQISPARSCLPLKIDPSLLSEPFVSPDADHFHQSETCLTPNAEELPDGELCLASDLLPRSDSCLDPDDDLIVQSESSLDCDNDCMPGMEHGSDTFATTKSCSDIEKMPQSESCLDPCTDLLPQSESFLVADTDNVAHSEPTLVPNTDHTPHSNSCLGPLPDQMPNSESSFKLDTDQMPLSEFFLNLDSNEMPQPESCLEPNTKQMPQLEFLMDPDTEKMSESCSCVDPCTDQLPHSESCLELDTDHMPHRVSLRAHDTDHIPQSGSCLDSCTDQFPQSESSLVLDTDHTPHSDPLVTDAEHTPHLVFSLESESGTVQMPHSESCSELRSDQMPNSESYLEPGTDQLSHSKCCLNPDTKEFSESDSCIDPCTYQLSHSESHLDRNTDQMPHSEFSSEPGTVQMPHSESGLEPVTDQMLHSESCLELDTKIFSKSGSCIDPCTYQMPHSEFSSEPGTDQMSHSESCLELDTDHMPHCESFKNHDTDHMPQSESCLHFCTDQFPQSESSLVLDTDHTPYSEPSLVTNAKYTPHSASPSEPGTVLMLNSVSLLETGTVRMPHSEWCLELETDQMPNSESSLEPGTDQMPYSESSLELGTDQMPHSESSLEPGTDQIPHSESSLELGTDQMPHSESSLEPGTDQMPHSESSLELGTDQMPHSESCLEPGTDQIPHSESSLEPGTDQMPHSESCLEPDTENMSEFVFREEPCTGPLPLPESFLKARTDQTPQSCSDYDTDQLSFSESCLEPDRDQLTESFLDTNSDHLALSELYMDYDTSHLSQSDSCLITGTDQLPQSGLCLRPNTDPMSLTKSMFAYDLDRFSLFELSMAPDNDQLPLPKYVLAHATDKIPLTPTPADPDIDQFNLSDTFLAHNDVNELTVLPSKDFSGFSSPSPLPVCSGPPHADTSPLPVCSGPPHADPSPLPVCSGPPHADPSPLPVCSGPPHAKPSPMRECSGPPHADPLPLPECSGPPHADPLPLPECSGPPLADPLPLPEYSGPPHADPSPLSEFGFTTCSRHLNFSEFSISPDTDQLPLSESTLVCDTGQSKSVIPPPCRPLSDSSQLSQPQTDCFNNAIENIMWDWMLNPVSVPKISVDYGAGLNLQPGNSTMQFDDTEDHFSIFSLDNPAETTDVFPETNQRPLSDDLLSLCDVFSQLDSNELIFPQKDSDWSCAFDQLPLHEMDSDFRTEQFPLIEEEITLTLLRETPVISQSPISTSIDKEIRSIEGEQLLCSVFDQHFDTSCALPVADSQLNHDFLDPNNDQSNFYCLDLLFEPARTQPENQSSPVDLYSLPHTGPSMRLPPNDITHDGPHSNKSQSAAAIHSSLGSISECSQLPMIVVTKDVLPQETLPPSVCQLLQPETDNPLRNVTVPHCEEQLNGSRLSPALLKFSVDSENPSPPLLQPQSDFETTPLPLCDGSTNLQVSSTNSSLENTEWSLHDLHDPADSQDPGSVPFSFGTGDPILEFSLDNNSPCVGDELARLRAVFDALDRDKDGFVKMEDFVQFATVYGAEQVKYLTGYLDPAGLGVINFRDFYRGISEIQNEDLDMQLYDMGYPSEEEPACSVDFDDLAAFEVTEVTDSAYVGSESAYSECETFTDEDTGGLAAPEDPETEGDGTGPRRHASATPEGLELALCDISVVTVSGQEEQFEDFGEGAEPDLFNNHGEEEQDSSTEVTHCSQHLSPSGAPGSERQLLAPPHCSGLGGLYCSQCHKHINRLEDLSSRLRYLEMDSPDKRTSSRKEARRLHHSGYPGEDTGDQQLANMACDETDLTDKVVYLEQRVSELERDATMTGEQQNRLRQENLHLLHRAHALEEQLKDQELRSDEVQSEETRKHRDELRKMERDRAFRLSSLKARAQELESENVELRSQLPSIKAATQRLEEEKLKLLDQVEELQHQLKEHQDQNNKLGGKLSMEKHKQQSEKERCQEVIEELRRELEQTQLMRLEMEHRMGLGNTAALQEYNSRTREAELEQEVRRLKQEQRTLKEQNEELNGQIINLSIQGAKNLFSTTFSDSLAAEISSVSRDELMEAIQKQEEINLRLQDYIDRIIVAIMETNPAILEVKLH